MVILNMFVQVGHAWKCPPTKCTASLSFMALLMILQSSLAAVTFIAVRAYKRIIRSIGIPVKLPWKIFIYKIMIHMLGWYNIKNSKYVSYCILIQFSHNIWLCMFIFHVPVETTDCSKLFPTGFTLSFTSMKFSVVVPGASIGKCLSTFLTVKWLLFQ